jgi:hypothetical protein
MTTATEVSLNGVTDGLASEEVSLVDFAEEPGGAWAPGWYAAETIEGYATAKGKEFTISDSVSQKGDSRNLRVCFKVTGPGGDRTMQENFNYRSSDFTAERQAYIQEARTENKGVKGRWADGDVQRSSLAVASLGQLQKGTGLTSLRISEGGLVAGAFIGKKVDVRLSIDEKGYNVITAFAPAGSKTAKGYQR